LTSGFHLHREKSTFKLQDEVHLESAIPPIKKFSLRAGQGSTDSGFKYSAPPVGITFNIIKLLRDAID